MNALISVIMPVYNGAAFLSEAIESVLGQTHVNLELLIVDDGSTDDTAALIQKVRDKRMFSTVTRHRGAACARNLALRMARGDLVAMMDADDLSELRRLEMQEAVLAANPASVAVGCNARYFTASGDYLFTTSHPITWGEIRGRLPEVATTAASLMIRRCEALRVGGYDERLRNFAEDIVFFNRLAARGEILNLEEPLYGVRLSPGSLSHNVSSREEGRVKRVIDELAAGSTLSAGAMAIVARVSLQKSDRWRQGAYLHRLASVYLSARNDTRAARPLLLRSVYYRPLSLAGWFNLFLSFLPTKIVRRWKKRYETRRPTGER